MATVGYCPGYIQVNLVSLPTGPLSEEFEQFCNLNPKPCPLLYKFEGVEVPNQVNCNVSTDHPLYRIHSNQSHEPQTIQSAKDFFKSGPKTSFLLGCSFSMDAILAQ